MIYLTILLCFQTVYASPFFTAAGVKAVREPHPPGSPEFYSKLIISTVLVLAGGMFAGYVSLSCGPNAGTEMRPTS